MINNDKKYSLIVSGASCTADSPWKTWADLVKEKYIVDTISLGKKALGNEAIITKVLGIAYKTENPIIVVMLTSVDKWDWYISKKNILSKIKHEKHNGYTILNEKDGAYWCTGSHFPLWKEFYKFNYFSLRQMLLNTIKHIDLLIKTCQSKNWPFFIGSDSKIFGYTESSSNKEYNAVKNNDNTALIDHVVEPFFNQIKKFVDLDGLFTTADQNNLEVVHKKFGAHPGTMVHYHYCKEKIFPFLNNFFQIQNTFSMDLIRLEQKLWDESNK